MSDEKALTMKPCSRCGAEIAWDDEEPVLCLECVPDDLRKSLNASRAKVAALEAELKTIRENGLNVLRLSVDEVRQPHIAIGLAKERITALEADVARLTLERDEAKDRRAEMRYTMGGLANNLAAARERIARLEAALREAITDLQSGGMSAVVIGDLCAALSPAAGEVTP